MSYLVRPTRKLIVSNVMRTLNENLTQKFIAFFMVA